MNKMLKRDHSIDLMRFIGLTMIVLAHIGLSKDSMLFQLRSFDVPLMVFTSGLAFSGKTVGAYLPFIGKRTLRLVVPVYIFATAYILLNPLLSDLGLVMHYEPERIWGTYILRLNPTMGYVWIIRVFLIVMLLTPLLLKLEKLLEPGWSIYIVAALMLDLQDLLVEWLQPFRSVILVEDWVLYVLAYPAAFLVGLRFRNASVKERLVVLVFLIAAMIVKGADVAGEYGSWATFQPFKYPPQSYFMLWGITISCFLWLTARWWSRILDNRLFIFIGRNTIWIYLWHIPFVNIVVGGPFDGWNLVWKYIFVYGAALCIYAVQYNIVKFVDRRWPENKLTGFFIG